MAALTGRARIAETYLAGFGASGALIAGAVIAFLVLVGTVAFDAWPRAGSLLQFDAPERERVVDASVPADAAAFSLAPAADLVTAADPETPLVTVPGGSIDEGNGGGGGAGTQTPGGGQAPAGGQQGGGTTTGGGGGGAGTITDTVNNTGQTLNNTVSGLGETVNRTVTGLGQTVNSTLNTTLNTVGGLLNGLSGN